MADHSAAKDDPQQLKKLLEQIWDGPLVRHSNRARFIWETKRWRTCVAVTDAPEHSNCYGGGAQYEYKTTEEVKLAPRSGAKR